MSDSKSAKKAQQEQEERMAVLNQVDPFKFGYKGDSAVTIPASVFMALLDYTGGVAQTEQKQVIQKLAFEKGTQPTAESQKEIITVVTSPIGLQAEQLFNELLNTHYENIDKGFAISLENKTLDLGDEPNV